MRVTPPITPPTAAPIITPVVNYIKFCVFIVMYSPEDCCGGVGGGDGDDGRDAVPSEILLVSLF